MRILLSTLVLLLGGGAVIAYFSFFIVHQNEQALVLEFGRLKRVIQTPGLNWKIPIVETVDYFDKRILDLDTKEQEVSASDQKRLNIDAFTRYKIVDPLKFYETIRDERMVASRLSPIVDSSIRRVLGAATFQEVVRDKREELMNRIAKQVNEEGKDFGIEVVDVRIKRADLPPQNADAVYKRMIAERQREAQQFRSDGAAEANRLRATADREATVIRAEAQRKGEIMRGEGDAERNRIFAEAYGRDQEFFSFYRSMQAYEAGFKPGETRLLISPDSEFMRYFSNPGGGASPPALTTKARP